MPTIAWISYQALAAAAVRHWSAPSIGICWESEWVCARPTPVGRATSLWWRQHSQIRRSTREYLTKYQTVLGHDAPGSASLRSSSFLQAAAPAVRESASRSGTIATRAPAIGQGKGFEPITYAARSVSGTARLAPTSSGARFNIRENRNKPTALSDHSFGFAVDVDAELNPNVKNAQEKGQPLIFDMVRELTGEDVFVGRSGQKQGKNIAEGTAAQIIPEVERLREISHGGT